VVPDAPVRSIGRTISDNSYRMSTLGITRRKQQKGRERPDLSTLCKVSRLAHLGRSDISFNRSGLLIGGRVRAVNSMPVTGWYALRERCAHAKAQNGRSDVDYLFHQILNLKFQPTAAAAETRLETQPNDFNHPEPCPLVTKKTAPKDDPFASRVVDIQKIWWRRWLGQRRRCGSRTSG
jgi:hypothetical protein